MTEKELKKLNRYQLLELLMMQTERADQLQHKLEEAERELKQQNIRLSKLGSIADASLQLSGVFEAAQEAADLYLKAVRQRVEEEASCILKRAEEEALAVKKNASSDRD